MNSILLKALRPQPLTNSVALQLGGAWFYLCTSFSQERSRAVFPRAASRTPKRGPLCCLPPPPPPSKAATRPRGKDTSVWADNSAPLAAACQTITQYLLIPHTPHAAREARVGSSLIRTIKFLFYLHSAITKSFCQA